jgi:hypothetical protein
MEDHTYKALKALQDAVAALAEGCPEVQYQEKMAAVEHHLKHLDPAPKLEDLAERRPEYYQALDAFVRKGFAFHEFRVILYLAREFMETRTFPEVSKLCYDDIPVDMTDKDIQNLYERLLEHLELTGPCGAYDHNPTPERKK